MEFNFERGAVAQGGVQPLGIVVVVEVLGQFEASFLQVGKAGSAGQQLRFEGAPAALGQRVVIRVARPAQAGNGLGAVK